MFRTALVLCGVLLVVIFVAQPVKADSGVTYTISGVYSSTKSASQLSGPSDTFTMSFALPSQPVTTYFLAGDDFYVDSPIPFSFSASNLAASFPSAGTRNKNAEFTQCWHQCPVCLKDWFHQMENSPNISPDLYYGKCPDCGRKR
jgi:hypothetical protein